MNDEINKKIAKDFGEILYIGVTGSVAAENPKRNDDIDLMIITKNNKLWLTRLGLRVWIKIKSIPHRNYGQEQKGDDYCFNLWLDESALELPKSKQTEKNAVDMILMKPILNKDGTYEKLLLANGWVKKYVATPYENKMMGGLNPPYPPFTRGDSNPLSPYPPFTRGDKLIGRFINKLFYWPQRWWMRSKIGQELVDEHRAFFHKS
jgi:hypothetical protein